VKWSEGVDYFCINQKNERISSINRTIRMKPDLFERIMELSEATGVSFNKIVNQCIAYALEHYREPER
jgi:predicted HicB family RNase H-like nuclease